MSVMFCASRLAELPAGANILRHNIRSARGAALHLSSTSFPTRSFTLNSRSLGLFRPRTCPSAPNLFKREISNIWAQKVFFTRRATLPPVRHTISTFGRRVVPSFPRHFFSTSPPISPLPPPSVSTWLFMSSALVFAIIVVGGVTRLTESGLSITEWKPITGILPPLSREEWELEFEKYRATPEFKMLNHQMTLSEFKSIFHMEHGHRVLGRLIGLVFVIPYAYYLFRRRLPPPLPVQLGGLALLIGFQGFLGWYMVKSGLEDEIMTTGAVPRVSQYRLAAHLGAALVLYAGMFGLGLAVKRDANWAAGLGKGWSGLKSGDFEAVLKNPLVRRFKGGVWGVLGLVFLTALSGAFVAGLDAGLVYNEFPFMGESIVPPTNELFSPAYAKKSDQSDKWWRNLLENPTTVQFDHRVLATTTYFSTAALHLISLRPRFRAALPPLTIRLTAWAFLAANFQVALGISTLIYLVPIPLAAAHQAGSVALLTAMLAVAVSLRRPGQLARLWRARQVVGTKHV